MDDRTRALHDAKRADSQRKHDRAAATVKRLLDSGSRVSFARVAREANVSTWLVYNSTELKTAIQNAIDQQNVDGLKQAPARPATAVSNASLMTDLALARTEIKSLKHERDALRKRIERVLGDEIREIDHSQLVERITELEHLLRAAHSDVADATKSNATLTEQNQELAEQLEAVRILNQRLIRQSNGIEPHETHLTESARNTQ
jgi:alpha-N-acetylglucosamine transferase